MRKILIIVFLVLSSCSEVLYDYNRLDDVFYASKAQHGLSCPCGLCLSLPTLPHFKPPTSPPNFTPSDPPNFIPQNPNNIF